MGTWRPELAKVITQEHVRTVADRITSLAPRFDPANNLNQRGLWYFLHVAVLFDFNHGEFDFNDDTTTATIERAIAAYTANPRVFEPTTANGNAMGELLAASTAPKLRPGRLPLTTRVLGYFAPGGAAIGDRGGTGRSSRPSRSTPRASATSSRTTATTARRSSPTPPSAKPSAPTPSTATSRARTATGPSATRCRSTPASSRSSRSGPS